MSVERKLRPTPAEEVAYAQLCDRLKSYNEFHSHRDDDREMGMPMHPLVACEKYFKAVGLHVAAINADEAMEYLG